jgi:hypothetical protein
LIDLVLNAWPYGEALQTDSANTFYLALREPAFAAGEVGSLKLGFDE